MLNDLGVHRLPDLGRPETVFGLVHPELPSTFPSLRSLDAFPGNLPVQLTSFVGRDREMKLIAEGFSSSRLITLTGTGGVGKTGWPSKPPPRCCRHIGRGVDVRTRVADPASMLQAFGRRRGYGAGYRSA